MQRILFILILSAFGFGIHQAYATEISAIPEHVAVGPNDWIKIHVQITDYSGGEISYKITKPDNSVESGYFDSLQASTKTHVISRNAFDHQFGNWNITYEYKNIQKSVDVYVKPLSVKLATDKIMYHQGEKIQLQILTNYYESNAAYGDKYTISILDQNNKTAILGIGSTTISADEPLIVKDFLVDDFLTYNPPGKYKIQTIYYGIPFQTSFEISKEIDASIFLGTDKSLYSHDDPIELNILIPKLTGNEGILKVYTPSGKLVSKNIKIISQTTKLFLKDVPTTESGTYKIILEYGKFSATKYFDIIAETLDKPNMSGLDLSITLNKKYYQPGENMQSTIQSSKIFSQPISYWLVDPNGISSQVYVFDGTKSTQIVLDHTLNIDAIRGSWKLYVKYGLGEKYQTFLVRGEPLFKEHIPDWIRNNAKWWSAGKINDEDFIQGIEYMVKNKLIIISEIDRTINSSSSDIPDWIRNNAKWWSEGIISDNEFLNNITYLIKIRVIHI